jgi:malate dehydrogenase (quinone)
MLDVIAKCFPDRLATWEPQIEKMIPSYGSQLSSNKATARSTLSRTAKTLAISA